MQLNASGLWQSYTPHISANEETVYTYKYPVLGLDFYTNYTFRVVANREDNDKQVVGRPSPQSETVVPDCVGEYINVLLCVCIK